MKSQIQALKRDLKSLSSQITALKATRKTCQFGYVPGLSQAQYLFRHKHIAYCLMRGRTMEQIENSNRIGNAPDMKFVEWIMESMKSESSAKLYVVVQSDLSKAQQAVQAGHAVAEFLKTNPNTLWSNGTLVYLKQKDLNWLYGIKNYEWAEFREPDLGNQVTAVAAFGPDVSQRLSRLEMV